MTYLIVPVMLSFLPGTQFHYRPVICRGSRSPRWVALTFDDGPDPGLTPAILETLEKYNLQATFFLIGKKIAGNESLIKSMSDKGHTLANHSFSHTNLWDFWMPARIHHDLEKTEKLLLHHTGKRVRFFRPPYGVINPMVSIALQKTDYEVICWSRWSLDTTTGNRNKLISRTTYRIRPGDIILLHDTQQVTADALEQVILSIHQQGFAIVPLEKLINKPAYA